MICSRGVSGGPGHFRVRGAFSVAARGEDPAVFDARRRMAIERRIAGDGIAGLFRPVVNQPASFLQEISRGQRTMFNFTAFASLCFQVWCRASPG